MKRQFTIISILIFVLIQVSWLALLGLWIFWFVSNYIQLSEVIEIIGVSVNRGNIAILVGGLVLLIAISVGAAVIFSNLTHQMKVTRMYDSFMANVTHELKSPLASIQLYLETLDARELDNSKRRDFVKLMMKDTHRLDNLINSILEISGLEEKRAVYQFRPYNTQKLIHSLVQEAVELFKLQEGTVTVTGETSCSTIADRKALQVVFNNLIDNAIKYSIPPVSITVSLSATTKRIVLDVTDNGVGIPHRHLNDVFKKFNRVHDPRSPNVKGTGLGLYWVKEIIHHHKGKVTAMSDGENQGSTFRIEIPVYNGALKKRNKLLAGAEELG